jgi:hypothetical protein
VGVVAWLAEVKLILAINKNGNYSSGTKSISVKTIKRAHK